MSDRHNGKDQRRNYRVIGRHRFLLAGQQQPTAGIAERSVLASWDRTAETFMACAITSLILFAAIGVLAVGFTALSGLKELPRVREDKAPNGSRGPVIA
jgi:hypothetical protein